ncbi:MAG: MscL family protein [Candidatus Heimdallarchaeota archaeon]
MEACFISDESVVTDEILTSDENLTTDLAILAELQLLRKGLVKPEEEAEPEEEKKRVRKLVDEFIVFIKKYRVFGVAVAFIMALYTGALIQAIVDDLLLPILSYIPGLETWATFQAGPFLIGHFVSATITFLLVALVVFIIIKIAGKIGIED